MQNTIPVQAQHYDSTPPLVTLTVCIYPFQARGNATLVLSLESVQLANGINRYKKKKTASENRFSVRFFFLRFFRFFQFYTRGLEG